MSLFEQIHACNKCPLCQTRRNAVPGEGNPAARLMLVGEGPGAEEDRLGRPFVGASGALLTALLHEIGVERTETYIANVVKCRPPQNRTPTVSEANACLDYLRAQVSLVRPRVLLLLGGTAARYVLGEDARVRRDRGKWTRRGGIDMMVTYHPSALLRDPALRRDAWADFKAVRDRLRELEAQ